jgi:hypothetical protein
MATIPTHYLKEPFDFYDAESKNSAGVITGGTTVVAGSARVMIVPLSFEEQATLGGSFDRTIIKILAEPTLDIQSGVKAVYRGSTLYSAGDTFRVQGQPQKFPDPMNLSAAHHVEAVLEKVEK